MNEHFERALERGFARMRARRGPCPSAETLAALASGQLPGTEAASVQSHVAVCGACDAMLMRLRKFEDAKAGDLPVDPQEAPITPKGFLAWTWTTGAFAAVGYALAAGALVCGYLGWLPWRNVERPLPSWQVAQNVDLNRVRGRAMPRVANASSHVILSFFVDIRRDLYYEVVLDGGEAKSIISSDGLGNFHLVVDRRLLGPGRHVLTVREANLRTVEFPFEMK